MESYSERRLAELREEARALLNTAIAAKRADLDPAEEMRWQELLGEIRALRGETPTSGDGWKIIPTPEDRALQIVSEQIWRIGFRMGWPEGWTVRFGELPAGDAARTFFTRKLVVIDLDNYRRRGDRDLEKSLHHELVHVAWRFEAEHDDPRFHQMLNELWDRVPRLIPAWRDSR